MRIFNLNLELTCTFRVTIRILFLVLASLFSGQAKLFAVADPLATGSINVQTGTVTSSYNVPQVFFYHTSLGGEVIASQSNGYALGARLLYWQSPAQMRGWYLGSKLGYGANSKGKLVAGLAVEGGWNYMIDQDFSMTPAIVIYLNNRADDPFESGMLISLNYLVR